MFRKIYHAAMPGSIRRRFYDVRKQLWTKLFPPVIVLNEFVDKGCKFEITTSIEKYRILSFGDEREFLESFLSSLKSDDVFFDIGSCIGLYAIHAGALGAEVVAFEPDPGYRKRLKKNIKINRLKRKIQVVGWAVSNKKGHAKLYTDGVEGNSPSLGLVGERSMVTVETNSLDSAISAGLPNPSIMKIDIEGAEILALQGMSDLLSSEIAPRLVFIEIHPKFLGNFGSTSIDCMKLIEGAGYRQKQCVKRENQLHCIYEKE